MQKLPTDLLCKVVSLYMYSAWIFFAVQKRVLSFLNCICCRQGKVFNAAFFLIVGSFVKRMPTNQSPFDEVQRLALLLKNYMKFFGRLGFLFHKLSIFCLNVQKLPIDPLCKVVSLFFFEFGNPKVTVHKAQYIDVRKLFKGGNYMRKYGIWTFLADWAFFSQTFNFLKLKLQASMGMMH